MVKKGKGDSLFKAISRIFYLLALCLTPLSICAELDYWAEFEQLKKGINYKDDVPRGLMFKEHQPAGEKISYPYGYHIPESYSPDKQWPVHIYLHGGVIRSAKQISASGVEKWDMFKLPNTISVFPSAWNAKKWWYKGQVLNITEILQHLKQEYNIDENRIFVQGVSDGGTGAYYVASHYPTAFAGFVPLIASMKVLSIKNKTYGNTFYMNFTNKPIYAVNTNKDPLYPAKKQKTVINNIKKLDGNIHWVIKKGKHDLRWFNEVRNDIHSFTKNTIRTPYPNHMKWQVDKKTEFKRFHWLIVGNLVDENKDGVIEVTKRDNNIFISSINLKNSTLLLSPEHFNFNENIRVWVDRTLVVNRKFVPNMKVLHNWFAIDNDRSMLFGEEITVSLLVGGT